MIERRRILLALTAAALCLPLMARAEKKYDPGASDTEIKLGQTMPYSGPASAFGTMGKTEAAYFQKINEQGGIRGRRITLISLDDGYSPPKTVEQTRRLVEQDGVLMIYGSVGTAHATATHKYLNSKGVPQLFIATSGLRWDDPKNFPWTMALPPNQRADGRLFAQHLLKTRPNAKVAILYQNDDYGKDYIKALGDALGAQAERMIVARASYEVTDPTPDSQIVALHGSGADALCIFASPKFAALAIRKVHDIGWKPLEFLAYPAASVRSVLQPAGLDKSVGIISAAFLKDAADPQWSKDPGMLEYHVHAQILRGRRPDRVLQCHGIHVGAGAGVRARALRRRSHAREHHETSGESEQRGVADAAARHHAADQPDRLRADRADAVDALRREK